MVLRPPLWLCVSVAIPFLCLLRALRPLDALPPSAPSPPRTRASMTFPAVADPLRMHALTAENEALARAVVERARARRRDVPPPAPPPGAPSSPVSPKSRAPPC
jgi:hypothetical protein